MLSLITSTLTSSSFFPHKHFFIRKKKKQESTENANEKEQNAKDKKRKEKRKIEQEQERQKKMLEARRVLAITRWVTSTTATTDDDEITIVNDAPNATSTLQPLRRDNSLSQSPMI